MTTSKELNLARKSLVASLGENAKVYVFSYLNEISRRIIDIRKDELNLI